tara:strand:+ start:793 stop:987 length:195 start_codon:yes stop_codon:yes gene_type:complete
MDENKLIEKYISQFNNNEKLAYEIAKQHLETSFDISRSIGFLEFKEKYISNIEDSSRDDDTLPS